MAQISFSDLENGIIPDASDFNTRFNALKDRFNNGIEGDNIAAASISTAKIINGAVTNEKITSMATTKLTGTLATSQGGTGSTANANAASGVVVLDADSKLPAVDGSLLTNLPIKGFGSWVALANNTVYLAETDGIVTAWATTAGPDIGIQGFTDANNPPTTVRAFSFGSGDCGANRPGITMPVKKGDYWKVNSNTADVCWIPLGK